MKYHQNKSTGFTLLELMVSMAVTIILVVFVNQIFTNAGGAVRKGVALSHLIGSTTIVTKQIEKDGLAMIGPRDGGFIVILNKFEKDVRVRLDSPSRKDVSGRDREKLPDLRLDQVSWIRERGNLKPLAPGGVAGDPMGSYSTASHVRIWYGHALRTDDDGKTPSAGSELGDDEPNDIGVNFILGRQALFLDGALERGIISKIPGRQVTIFAKNAKNTASVQGDFGSGAPGTQLFLGLTDIAAQSLGSIRSEFNQAGSGGGGDLAKIALSYTFADQRLHVNPKPNIELGYELWQIAQMHGHFVSHVTDFEVSFAGDFQPRDGYIDMEKYDVDAIETGSQKASYNRIKWYDMNNPPTSDLSNNVVSTKNGDGWAFTPGSSNWPHMLRIRFRANDSQGNVVGADQGNGQSYEVIIRVNRN